MNLWLAVCCWRGELLTVAIFSSESLRDNFIATEGGRSGFDWIPWSDEHSESFQLDQFVIPSPASRAMLR